MKNPCLFLTVPLLVLFFSCKKSDQPGGSKSGSSNDKYYTSDAEIRTMGLVPMSYQQFNSFTPLKASAIAKLSANARRTEMPSYFVMGMPPQFNQRDVPASAAITVGYTARSFNYQKVNNTDYTVWSSSGMTRLDSTHLFNPFFIYNQLPVSERQNLYSIFDFILHKGVSTWADMPFSRDTTIQPTDVAKTNALKYKPRAAYRLDKYDLNLFKMVMRDMLYPIIVGVTVDNGFARMNKAAFRERPRYDTGSQKVPIWNKYISAGDPSDNIDYDMQKSLHTMVICGWDDVNRAFLVFNSWGYDWGENGYMWVDYDFLKEALYYDNYGARPLNPYAFILTEEKSAFEGLVAGYKFDSNTNDISGNGNHGVVSSNVSFGTDRKGSTSSRSIKFEGSKLPGSFTIPNSTSLQFTDEASVSFWIRIDSVDGTDWDGSNMSPAIYNYYSKSSRVAGPNYNNFDALASFAILHHLGDPLLANWVTGGEYGGNSSTGFAGPVFALKTHDWHHIVNVYKKSESSLYFDGKLVAIADIPVYFGRANNYDFVFNNFYKMNGAFDDIYIYNQALDADQVRYLYEH